MNCKREQYSDASLRCQGFVCELSFDDLPRLGRGVQRLSSHGQGVVIPVDAALILLYTT
jgi:hypothetical protein